MEIAEIERQIRESGLPPDKIHGFEQDRMVLQAIEHLSGFDADKKTQDLWTRLPHARKSRADELRAQAINHSGPEAQIKRRQAERLTASASKLESPNINNTFKARAFATEFSATVSLQLRGLDFSKYCPTPDTAKQFKASHANTVRELREAGLALEQAQIIANREAALMVALALRQKRGLQAGIDDFIAGEHLLHRVEAGHLHDISLDSVDTETGKPAPEIAKVLSSLATTQETDSPKSDQKLARALSGHLHETAAQHLNDRQYVIFRVLMDEGHAIRFERGKSNEITAKKAVSQGVETGETPAHFVMQALPDVFHGRGAAQRALNETLSRLDTALHGPVIAGKEKDKAKARQATDTRTLVRREQERKPLRKKEKERTSEIE